MKKIIEAHNKFKVHMQFQATYACLNAFRYLLLDLMNGCMPFNQIVKTVAKIKVFHKIAA